MLDNPNTACLCTIDERNLPASGLLALSSFRFHVVVQGLSSPTGTVAIRLNWCVTRWNTNFMVSIIKWLKAIDGSLEPLVLGLG